METEKCRFDKLETMLGCLLDQADELVMNSPEGLPMTSMDEISLPANGQFGPFKFINMCVVDSILMATYCCYLKTDQVRSLFGSHKILRATMVFMGAKMYDKAKACWLFAQKVLFENSTIIITEEDNTDTQQLDAWSEPTDHLNIFNELVLVKYHYDEDRNSPPDCISQEVLINILRTFEDLGDVRALGMNEHQPTLIWVDINQRRDKAPPLKILDCYSSVYELQFLLMTRKSCPSHVIVGLLSFDGWVLYDNLKTDYEDFNPEMADFKEDFIILLAGYVNIPQDEPHDVPFGIAEEDGYGTRVFNAYRPFVSQQKEHED